MRFASVVTIILAVLFAWGYTEKAEAVNMDFSVTPILTKQASSAPYFHRQVKPGETVTVKVVLENKQTESLVIDIEPANAFSNPFGSMYYTGEEETEYSVFLDKTYKMTHYLTGPESVTLKAKERKTVSFKINVPSSLKKGQLLGGINFSLATNQTQQTKNGKETNVQFGVTQQYSVAILLDLPKKTDANVQLRESQIDTSTKMTELRTMIENVNPAVANDLRLKFKVTKVPEKEVVLEGMRDLYNLAPVTNLIYLIPFEKDLEDGAKYLVELELLSKSTNRVISKKEEILIKEKKSDKTVATTEKKKTGESDDATSEANEKHQEKADKADKDNGEGSQFFVKYKIIFFIFILFLLILLLLLYIVYRMGKRKGKQEAEKQKAEEVAREAAIEKQEK